MVAASKVLQSPTSSYYVSFLQTILPMIPDGVSKGSTALSTSLKNL